jgi:hypothetical protein
MKQKVKLFAKMFALAVVTALILTKFAIAGHVLFNGVSDTWYIQTGNAVLTGHAGSSDFDDRFTLTPFSFSAIDSEFSQLSFYRSINKPNEWTSSYSFGQTTQWQGEEKYTELIDIAYSNWSGDIDTGYGFAIQSGDRGEDEACKEESLRADAPKRRRNTCHMFHCVFWVGG